MLSPASIDGTANVPALDGAYPLYHTPCHDQDACHAAAHYSAFMVARCSHLFRFVPLDSLLDKCMARASDHSALSTLAALQLSPETQVYFCLWQILVTLQPPCAHGLHRKARCNGDDYGLSHVISDVCHAICHCRTKPLPTVWRQDSFTAKTTQHMCEQSHDTTGCAGLWHGWSSKAPGQISAD